MAGEMLADAAARSGDALDRRRDQILTRPSLTRTEASGSLFSSFASEFLGTMSGIAVNSEVHDYIKRNAYCGVRRSGFERAKPTGRE
jgi:hypothetical protein